MADIFQKKLNDAELAEAFGVEVPEVNIPFLPEDGYAPVEQVSEPVAEIEPSREPSMAAAGAPSMEPQQSPDRYQQLLDMIESKEKDYSNQVNEARDRDAQIALMEQLNKAFSGMNVALAGKSGIVQGLKPSELSLKSDLASQVSGDRDKELKTLLEKVKLMKKNELTPYQQQMLDIYRQKETRGQAHLDARQSQEERIANQQQINTIRGFLKDDPTYKAVSEQKMEFDKVKDVLQEAKSGNQTSLAALGAIMAKAMGERGVLTDQDVARYVKSASWWRGLQDWVSKGAKGTLPEATAKDLLSNINIIEKKLSENENKIFKRAASRVQASYPELDEKKVYGVLGYTPSDSQQSTQPTQTQGATGPYGDTTTKDGKNYKWNPAVGKYQLVN